MAVPTITLLPDAPSRSQGQEAFNLKADPFIAALPPMVLQVNLAITWQAAALQSTMDYMTAASASRDIATNAAVAAAQSAGIATQQAVLATSNGAEQVALAAAQVLLASKARDSAQAFAAAAGSAAGLPSIASKQGKSLVVNPTATGVLWGDPYPAYAGKSRQALQVLPSELGVRWVDVGDRISDVLVSARNPGSLYLLADGSIYSQSAYPDLYSKVGLIGGSKAQGWTSLTSGFSAIEIIGTATDGAGVWIFLGANGSVRRSTDDGVTNAVIAGLTISLPKDVVYAGNGTFVILGNVPFRSTDQGLTWSSVSSGLSGTQLCIASNGMGTVLIGGSYSSRAWRSVSRDYGATWATGIMGAVGYASTSAVGVGKDGRCFSALYSYGVDGGGSNHYWNTLHISIDYALSWSVHTANPMSDSISTTGYAASIATDNDGLWLITSGASAYRLSNNGDALLSLITTGPTGKVATDCNGTWAVGSYRSSDNAINFTSSGLAAPVPSCLAASRAGTFMVGGTSGSLRRSVPVFGYDPATQFALPTIASPIGVKAYIKAKEEV